MKQRFQNGGLAAWSIKHPIGISMMTLTVIILGLFSFKQLGINLLPHIIAPDVRVRISDSGVPASIMEDRVTKQLEEQLSITEDAISINSRTSEGRSSVDLSFPYGTDINNALRDASIRLDRAKRFLPENNEAPVIYKRDPAQIPVLELVLSSHKLNTIELRNWADYTFSNWFLNLPGIAAVEVGGGLEREVQIIPDQEKLASVGLTLQSLAKQIAQQNNNLPGGKMITENQEIVAHAEARLLSIEAIKQLPLQTNANRQNAILVTDVARVVDTNKEEKLRIRLNTVPGIKLSIQKQPQANTVSVVAEVKNRIANLKAQGMISRDINLAIVADQSIYIKHAINNAMLAATSGAILAMIVVYLFLGSFLRTLIIGTAIPIGILFAFILMQYFGLTLNIMTLGAIALGMGLLIDSTIVMLENITRHQAKGKISNEDTRRAAAEVSSPIIASTSTNLAGIIPFLFIGGMAGMLFQELIITITCAMLGALVVAITLVPALGAKITYKENHFKFVKTSLNFINEKYSHYTTIFLNQPIKVIIIFCIFLGLAVFQLINTKRISLPTMDEGKISLSITGDPGMQLEEMDKTVTKIERLLLEQNEVQTLFTTAGGFIFGRSTFESSNHSAIRIQLISKQQRKLSSKEWAQQIKNKINALKLIGFKVHLRVSGIRGLKLNHGSDDVSIHIRGNDLNTLRKLADKALIQLASVNGLTNLTHSYEEVKEELSIQIDHQRAHSLGIDPISIAEALNIGLEGKIVSQYIDQDKDVDIRLRLAKSATNNPNVLQNLLVGYKDNNAIRLADVAKIVRAQTSSQIIRSEQQRIVEISASYKAGVNQNKVLNESMKKLKALELPDNYLLYDNDSNKTLNQGQQAGLFILFVALFLVFAVMAIQYESLLNPLIIMLSIPFSAIGVAFGFMTTQMSLSLTVWLGLVMLTGIVVNNAIVLVEQIEIERNNEKSLIAAIKTAAKLRLRPILMTTLTTVFGMLPLAIGFGEGSEMLQPLAFVIVWGLSFSFFVSLIFIPTLYLLFHQNKMKPHTIN